MVQKNIRTLCNSQRRGFYANHVVGREIGRWVGWRGLTETEGGRGNYAKFRMSVCQLLGSGAAAVLQSLPLCVDSDTVMIMKQVCKKYRDVRWLR